MDLKTGGRLSDESDESSIAVKATPRRKEVPPFVSIVLVVFISLSAASGVALSVIIVFFNLESDQALDFPSRIVLFAASCVSLLYVVLHLIASRTSYVKGNASPQVYGKYAAAVAFLLAQVGLLGWIGAVVTTALVAARTRLDFTRGIGRNAHWLSLLVSVVAL
jgi:hypothetical protein